MWLVNVSTGAWSSLIESVGYLFVWKGSSIRVHSLAFSPTFHKNHDYWTEHCLKWLLKCQELLPKTNFPLRKSICYYQRFSPSEKRLCYYQRCSPSEKRLCYYRRCSPSSLLSQRAVRPCWSKFISIHDYGGSLASKTQNCNSLHTIVVISQIIVTVYF